MRRLQEGVIPHGDENGSGRKDHHNQACRSTDPRLNRSTPARVQMLPPVAPAALQRSLLQQEILVLTVAPRISMVPGLYLSGQVG